MLASATMRRFAASALACRRSPAPPPRLVQAARTRALQQAAALPRVLHRRLESDASAPVTAKRVLSEAAELLSPEDYSSLEELPLDESGLPKLEQQQRAQSERQSEKKRARRAMLEDVKRTVGKRLATSAHDIVCAGQD